MIQRKAARPTPAASGTMLFSLLLVISLFAGTALRAEEPARPPGLVKEFTPRELKVGNGDPWKYAIFVPPQYNDDPEHRWPVILCLHGSGEIGTEGVRQTRTGLPREILKRPTRFPFIVVMPQAHAMWFRGPQAGVAWAMLEATHHEFRTDRDRVYLTGLSMGGIATWELAVARPDTFAAIVPVCGAAPIDLISNIADVPTWAFHGAKDKNVPVGGSRLPIAKLRELGGDPQYTEYPTLGHKVWGAAYATPELWRWLLEQRRPGPPRKIDFVVPAAMGSVWWVRAWTDPEKNVRGRIRAEITDDRKLLIETKALRAWAVVSSGPPLSPGDEVEIVLNGESVFSGKFTGAMGHGIELGEVAAGRPTSQPASQPAE